MTRHAVRAAAIAAVVLSVVGGAPAGEVGPRLPETVRDLLRREMNAIQAASLEIQGARFPGEPASQPF